jgi:hypothetical protein
MPKASGEPTPVAGSAVALPEKVRDVFVPRTVVELLAGHVDGPHVGGVGGGL